ncbi:flagellar biosynthetic protein FliR [Palleronia salina]|uniref:Flagellar biosynthetic protein FliR n=2 Tax=Palleronia TaxID=315422 RepID=A0A1M6CXD1_9RHOB|nr:MULTISPECIES: flagellar biosynthetic protein FliR [Palleronia]SEN25569.1 flagellar biosynthetic protein FliR [Palleronia pelagia]SHI65511.1 flagellar biosynthetic protein FliR [Palleronia salina]
MSWLEAFATSTILGFFVVFARLGSALIFMPGFGETAIPVRERLLIALVLAASLYPVMGIGPMEEGRPMALALLFGAEVTVGLWIGLVARTLLSALQFAGYQIALMSGLANALAPNVGAFQGATSLAAMLLMGAVALIFITDLHHLIIGSLVMSYEVFAVGQLPIAGLADQFARAAQLSLYIGLSIAAPFFVAGVVLNIGMGLANRMMATLPVFFVAQPLLIAAALGLMVLAIPAMMMGFLQPFSDWLTTFGF